MESNTLPDIASQAMLGAELDRFKPKNVLWVEEHVLDNSAPLLALEWVPRENNLLEDDPVRVSVHRRAAREKGEESLRVGCGNNGSGKG